MTPNERWPRNHWGTQRSAATALSPLSAEFNDAYSKAHAAMIAAVEEFERATGRTVRNAEVCQIETTHLHSTQTESMRNAELYFFPTEAEVPSNAS
jgi:hypothetical protein